MRRTLTAVLLCLGATLPGWGAPILTAMAPAPVDPGTSLAIPLTLASGAPTIAGMDVTLSLLATPADALSHAKLTLEPGSATADWQFLALDTPTSRALLVNVPGVGAGAQVLVARVTLDLTTPRDAVFTLSGTACVTADTNGVETTRSEVLTPVALRLLTCTPGDLNRDGRVSVGDAVLCIKLVLNPTMTPPNSCFRDAADASGDGTVNIADVLVVLRKAAGL